MSLFNTIVPPHRFARILLNVIRWGQPITIDGKQKYPLMGRMTYVWMSEDYSTIKLLLKDGPSSWSEQRQEVMDQIRNHETFVSVNTDKKDDCYIIAEFKPIPVDELEHLPDDIKDSIDGFMMHIEELDRHHTEMGEHPITKHPMVIFDEQMEIMKSLPPGVMLNEEVAAVANHLNNLINGKDE